MTEEQIKFICKWAIQNGNHRLSNFDKEIIKQAIDRAETIDDLAIIACAMLIAENNWNVVICIIFHMIKKISKSAWQN